MDITKKYENLYKTVEKMTPEDTIQLVLNAETQDEKDFFNAIGNFLLQKKQRDSIKRNVF